MKKLKIVLFALFILFFGVASASGATIGLFDYNFNIDGTTGPALGGVDLSLFDTGTGLGSISVTITGVGTHFFIGFFDHEIDEAINTYFNENGAVFGSLAAGQSWEIDEPGYFFGDIYDNFLDGSLDNFNNVPAGLEDDVSMAMGWDFDLAASETAVINLVIAAAVPENYSGVYLKHTDPESNASIFLSSTLTIRGGQQPVPEPATMLLLGTGLAGLAGFGRRRFKK